MSELLEAISAALPNRCCDKDDCPYDKHDAAMSADAVREWLAESLTMNACYIGWAATDPPSVLPKNPEWAAKPRIEWVSAAVRHEVLRIAGRAQRAVCAFCRGTHPADLDHCTCGEDQRAAEGWAS